MENRRLISEMKFNKVTLKMNLEGVDDSISEVEPKADVNSIKWILQHILTSRIALLKNLDLKSIDELELYEMKLEGLYNYYNDLQKGLKEFLSKKTDIDDDSAMMISKYMLHESYHIGQIGFCRRFLGLPGAIY